MHLKNHNGASLASLIPPIWRPRYQMKSIFLMNWFSTTPCPWFTFFCTPNFIIRLLFKNSIISIYADSIKKNWLADNIFAVQAKFRFSTLNRKDNILTPKIIPLKDFRHLNYSIQRLTTSEFCDPFCETRLWNHKFNLFDSASELKFVMSIYSGSQMNVLSELKCFPVYGNFKIETFPYRRCFQVFVTTKHKRFM